MSGVVAGLDISACLHLPSLENFDPEVIEELLFAAEQGALIGIHKNNKESE